MFLKSLGVLSYGAALMLAILDNCLWVGHWATRKLSDRFLSDGDMLTGWRIARHAQQ